MPLLFTNCFDLKVDGKHRLFVPTEVRKQVYQAQLGEAFFVTMGRNQKLWLYPEKAYESLLEKIPHDVDAAPEPDMLDYLHLRFALSSRMVWDEGGRLVLPERLLKLTGIENEITLAGCGDHLQIWSRKDWEAHSLEVLQKTPEIVAKWKQTAKPPPPPPPQNGAS